MVSTRRGTANAELATAGTERPKSIRQASDTIHVLIPSTQKVARSSLERKVPGTPPNMAISSTISEHDLSLTSPSTGKTPKLLAMSTPKKKKSSIDHAERTVSSALRRLAPMPFANMSGSCHNPIIVDETASPPQRTVRAPRRRHRQKRLTEPHQFIGNGYRDLYSYRVSRPALTAMPANGSTFTGHQSHDIYRMMNAKITAAPDFSPNAAWGRDTLNVPFELQYPFSAWVLTQQQNTPQHQPPYAQYHQIQAPPNAYQFPMVLSQNEDLLRRRAARYIREYSRHSPQKRRLYDAAPDETSDDKAKGHRRHARRQPSIPTSPSDGMTAFTVYNDERNINHKPQVYQDPDPNFLVGHLIEHTSLITSLLQLYPHSTDRKGLRNDISMMIQVQNQHVIDWMKAEPQNSRKRRKNTSDSVDNRSQPIITPATRIQNEKDDTLREVFSANADMWQDGTGRGVADVFAVAPASSPVASSSDERIAKSTHMHSTSMPHGYPTQERTSLTGSVITAPTEQIPISAAEAAPYKGIPTSLSMEDMQATFNRPPINPKDKSKSLTNLSLPSTSPKDPATPSKSNPLTVSAFTTPILTNKHYPPSSHSKHSNHTTPLQPAPSVTDNNELDVPNNDKPPSSLRSESSTDFRIRKPVFRFEQRVAVLDGRV